MSTKTIQMEDALHAYYLNATLRETEVQKRLRDETAKLSHGHMQISPEQGQFMALLIELMGAREALEIGTFTGYSALCVARALPKDGRLIACDVSEEWTSIGKRYWEEAGLADRIDLRIGPAAETLDRMIENGETGDFDFAFIDADKLGYDGYYEQCLILLRAGGGRSARDHQGATRRRARDDGRLPDNAQAGTVPSRGCRRCSRHWGADRPPSGSSASPLSG